MRSIGEDAKAARPPRFGGFDRSGKDSGGLAMGAARRDQPVDRRKEIRMFELAGNAHAVGQIEMAEPPTSISSTAMIAPALAIPAAVSISAMTRGAHVGLGSFERSCRR